MWPFKRRSDDDFRSEIEAHIALEADRLITEGVNPDEARHAAARRFGNVSGAQERFYESGRVLWLDELRQDLRYAVRTLRRSPGFAAVAILTLTLGIGANTAIFSVVNAVLLRPLPYHDPGSLVLLEPSPITSTPPWVASAWRDRAASLSDFAGFRGPAAATLVHRDEPEPIDSAEVSSNFFSFLGVPPALGRDFTEQDALPGAPPVAMVSHDFWMRRFGGDRDIPGTAIALGADLITIIGVTAPTFRFPTAASALPASGLPIDTQPDVIRVAGTDRSLTMIGRLSPAATPASAAAELLGIFRQQAAEQRYAQSLLDRMELGVAPLQQRLAGDVRQRLLLVMGAVGFVLLVACANIANLLLARASTRQRELAVRSALGARKGRLARLVLTESLLLALIGSAAALLLTWWTSALAHAMLADRLPHVGAIAIDWWVLGFTVGIAAVTGVLCGLAAIPAVTRVAFTAMFNDGREPAIAGRTAIRRALLSTEVAVTFILVVGAALLGQTLWNLNQRERGFDADRVMTMRVSPGFRGDIREGQAFFASFFTDLTQRVARLDGIASAAAVSNAPLAGIGLMMGKIAIEGQAPQASEGSSEADTLVAAVTPGYFRTMRIALRAGRDFDDRDRRGSEQVAIVNEAFHRRFAPNVPVVGARVQFGDSLVTVVGVAEDVPERSLRDTPRPLVFTSLAQMEAVPFMWGQLTLVVRGQDGDPRALAPMVQREIWAVNPTIVVDEVATMGERVAATVRAERESATLIGLLAVAALMIAAVGVYGVAAYAMAQRTKEIGIRVALGAARRDVARLVITQTLWPTLLGIAAGLAGASAATRVLASMLYGVTPLDRATFIGAALVLVSVALAATGAPVRRATRIDPLVALRYE